MISSFFDGRVRLRSKILSDSGIAENLSALLKEMDGVKSVSFSRSTGSLLVEYDPALIPRALMLKAAPLLSRMNDLGKAPAKLRAEDADALLAELKALLDKQKA